MNYIGWTVLALLAYTVFPPLVNLATRTVPSAVVTLVAASAFALGAAGVVVYRGERVTPHLVSPGATYMYAAALALTVGLLAYYYALSVGPVSVVVPLFGMFVVTSSLLGIAVLEEPLTARKLLGIAFAALAIYLIGVE
ncbi:MAG: EamA family transporter [Halalkalicoccus sp.]|nr:EamA family transporter [Halalkalicoccus sp.]